MSLCMHNMKRYLVSSLLLLCGFISPVSAEISLYPHASLEYHKINTSDEHQFLLSTPKRISNTLQIENEVLLPGERHNLLLNIKASDTSKAAFEYYKKQFSMQGELMYSCEERACGSSNYWANSIFNESKLYGRDSEQYYLAGRMNVEENNYYVSVYLVKNGRKQAYIYLSYVLDKSERVELSNVQDTKHINQLNVWQQGVSFEKPSLNNEQKSFIKKSLADNKSLSIWMVGFAEPSKKQKVADAFEISDKALELFSSEVSRQLNVGEERIKVINMGPFEIKPNEYLTKTWFRLYLRR